MFRKGDRVVYICEDYDSSFFKFVKNKIYIVEDISYKFDGSGSFKVTSERGVDC